jgi:hypothetical protein
MEIKSGLNYYIKQTKNPSEQKEKLEDSLVSWNSMR